MLHGQTRYNVPSRFFREIPDALMKKLAPARVSFSPYSAASRGYGGTVSRPVVVQPAFEQADSPWRIGQNVVHPKFGSGVIVSAEGRGADARVQVNFRNSGLKWLMLEYARLAPS
jgi:DNA helicase-2/ATP-dependent DNA helicase PcrA